MIKKLGMAALFLLSLSAFALAEYPSDVVVLDKAAISKLSDDQLVDAYENALVEIEANRSFHATSGFSPKEYKDYKGILKFQLELLAEIRNRNLEAPHF